LIRRLDDAAGEARFSMLQTIREYALELLRAYPGHSELHDRHARFYLILAETENLEGTDRAAAEARIGSEHDNMRAALKWWLQSAEDGAEDAGVLAARLAVALGGYWYKHGLAVEGAMWLERALSTGVEIPQGVRALALQRLGVLNELQRNLDRAEELFEEALTYFRESGDREGEGACLSSLGVVARNRLDSERAEELLLASLKIRREIGDDAGTSTSMNNLGIIYLDVGDLDRAERLFADAMEIDRRLGDDWGIACTFANLGVAYLERGDVPRGRAFFQDAMRDFLELGDVDGVAECLESLAGAEAADGRALRAARLAGAAETLRRTSGIPGTLVDRVRLERWLNDSRVELGRAGFETAKNEGAQMTLGQAIDYARESGSS
jgi:tetratricopeptide (TPR) repeat protein